ncbi:TrmH family RNA methyltransferase [Thermodesulfobacteriota bacterium]
MGLRKLRRKLRARRTSAIPRFMRHKRQNLLAVPGAYEYVIVLDHLKPEYNIGKIFRSADAFGAHEVHLIGIDFFDPAPAKGSFKWVPAKFHEDFGSCYAELKERNYSIYMMDAASGRMLSTITLPERSAFVFGHEEFGFSFHKEEFSALTGVKIPQLGKVQSLNVSIAASIVMYEYVRQHDE